MLNLRLCRWRDEGVEQNGQRDAGNVPALTPSLGWTKVLDGSKVGVMKLLGSNRKTAALTLVEVLVVVASLALLITLAIPALVTTKKKAQLITCNGRLKQVGCAFRIWSGGHANLYPMSVSTNFGGTQEYLSLGETFRHFQVMSNELCTPIIPICPSDVRQPANDFGSDFNNTTVSYFVGADANEKEPKMLISGDRNLVGGVKFPNGIVEIATNQLVRWSSELHDGRGNIGFADGSVWQAGNSELTNLLQETGIATNRLAIP